MAYPEDEDEMDSYKFREAEGDALTDWEDQEEVDTIPCPRCGKQVHEEAQRCHKCGHWIEEEQRTRLPKWAIITAILCILMAIYLTVAGGGLLGW